MKNIHILQTEKPSRLHLYTDEKGTRLELCELEHSHTRNTQDIYITSDDEIREGDYWIYICHINGLDYGDNNNPIVKNNLPPTWFEKLHDKKNYKKIILTTDQDLIKDGVQDIDNDFLHWFVKNPSCEEVETAKGKMKLNDDNQEYGFPDMSLYKIIIPKEEELKQEVIVPDGYYDEDSKDFEITSLVDFTDDEQESIEIMQEAKAMGMRQETLEELSKDFYSDDDEMMLRIAFKRGYTECEERMYSKEEVLEQLNILMSLPSSTLDKFTDEKDNITMKWFKKFKKK
jgi:hypothetical protein